MIQAYMLTRHATGSITSRHSFASKSQDSTVKSVQALISYGACSNMFTTNIAHGVRGYHSKCSDEIVIVGSLKFSSDPFGESRATWFVFSFFAVLCIVCFPLLSSMFDFFCGGSVVSAFVFLVDTMFVRSRWHFSFSRYSFLPPLWFIVERVKLCHPKVRVMSQYGGQKRDLILEPVSGPISASLEGASIVSPKGSAGLLAGLSLIY